MKAMVKCSNCGAEISNMNFSWGKKQWLWMIPIFVFALLPTWTIYSSDEGDFREDLQVNLLERRVVDSRLEILGTIQNTGKTEWESIELDAEFYAEDGKFLDEASSSIFTSLKTGMVEHFKMEIMCPSEHILSENTRMELKVAHAFSYDF